jgi:hypothetical protein
VDQNHVKYFLDLEPGKKQLVEYSVTYKRRKVGPEINTEKKREPLQAEPVEPSKVQPPPKPVPRFDGPFR